LRGRFDQTPISPAINCHICAKIHGRLDPSKVGGKDLLKPCIFVLGFSTGHHMHNSSLEGCRGTPDRLDAARLSLGILAASRTPTKKQDGTLLAAMHDGNIAGCAYGVTPVANGPRTSAEPHGAAARNGRMVRLEDETHCCWRAGRA
jgi:hypothetical protein